MHMNRIASALLLMAVATTAGAQQKGKKLYCWEENGQRTCGDALPPGAVELARTEISARTGRATGQVARALTEEELAAAAAREKQAAADTLVAAAQRRRDMAMVESYATEQDLRNAYGERIGLLDDVLKASAMGEENLRRSLVSLLGQANNLELAGTPVPAAMLAKIQAQHADLLKQQRIIADQRVERASLDGELVDALARYRAFKNPDEAEPAR